MDIPKRRPTQVAFFSCPYGHRNIITVEYLHRHKSSNVNKRKVGLDTSSFTVGLRHVFCEAPDVIMVGEVRDCDSIAIALEAADTSHLVLSSRHANSVVMAINRIVDVFPAESQQQIRVNSPTTCC